MRVQNLRLPEFSPEFRGIPTWYRQYQILVWKRMGIHGKFTIETSNLDKLWQPIFIRIQIPKVQIENLLETLSFWKLLKIHYFRFFFSKLQFDFSQTQIWYGWMIREHFVIDRCVPGILVSLDVFSIWKALNELHIFGMHDEWLLNWVLFGMNEILLNLPCSVLAGAIGVRKLLRPSKNEKKKVKQSFCLKKIFISTHYYFKTIFSDFLL